MTIILACYFFVIGDYHCLEVVSINEKIATHLRFYRRIIFSNERLFFQRIFANRNAIAECLEILGFVAILLARKDRKPECFSSLSN